MKTDPRTRFQDLPAAQRALRNLVLAMFEPLRRQLPIAHRQPVVAFQRAMLRRRLRQLDDLCDQGDPCFDTFVRQSLDIEPTDLGPQWAPELGEPGHRAYRQAVAALPTIAAVRQEIDQVRAVLRAQPEILLDEYAFQQQIEAALAAEQSPPAAQPEPPLEEIGHDASDTGPPLGQDFSRFSEQLSLEGAIQTIASLLFDLVARHTDSRLHEAVETVEAGFVASCNASLGRLLDQGRDPWALIDQVMLINPLRLKVSRLPGVATDDEADWHDAVRAVQSPKEHTRYRRDLELLRRILPEHRDKLRDEDFPQTLDRLLRRFAPNLVSSGGVGQRLVSTGSSELFTACRRGRALIATLAPEACLSLGRIEQLQRELLAAVQEDTPPRLVLNLGPVREISSAFVGVLFAINKRIAAGGGRLCLCELQPQVVEVFELCQVPRLVGVCATLEEAIKRVERR